MTSRANRTEKERRRHSRIVFKPLKRPKLKIKENEFEVENISEGGIRFLNPNNIHVSAEFNGTITFKDGDTFEIEGKKKWEKEGSVGVASKHPVPQEIVIKDEDYVYIDLE